MQVLPAMVEAGHGTILFTGATAAIRGGANFAALACPKFALRALSQSIAREFQPKVSNTPHRPVLPTRNLLQGRVHARQQDLIRDGLMRC